MGFELKIRLMKGGKKTWNANKYKNSLSLEIMPKIENRYETGTSNQKNTKKPNI